MAKKNTGKATKATPKTARKAAPSKRTRQLDPAAVVQREVGRLEAMAATLGAIPSDVQQELAAAPRISPQHRAPGGTFLKGNPGGPGNPHAAKVQSIKSLIYSHASPTLIAQAWIACQRLAAGGNIEHLRLMFEVLGLKKVPVNVNTTLEIENRFMLLLRGSGQSMKEEYAEAQRTIAGLIANAADAQVQPVDVRARPVDVPAHRPGGGKGSR